jgi:hypothetical protein
MSGGSAKRIGMIPALVLEEAESGEDGAPPPEGDVEEQSLFGRKPKAVPKPVEIDGDELRKNIENITAQLERVLESQAEKKSGFNLDSFSVGLAVEGKGKVFLVAEVGVKASIELTFKRRESS